MARKSVSVLTKLCLALAFNRLVSVSSFCAHRELSMVFRSSNSKNKNKHNRIHQTTTTTTMMMMPSNNNVDRYNYGITRKTTFKNSAFQEENRRIMFPSSLSSRKQQENSLLRRSMYNLPPGGGGSNNNNNDIGSIAKSALTVLGIVAFFASPLGGIFFAITNSVLLLLFLTPVVGFLGFQVWEKFNTIEGPCPGCGAPTKVMKDSSVDGEGAVPAVCLSCGAFVKSSPDGKQVIDMNANSNSMFNNDVILDATEDGGYAQQQGGVSTPFDSILSDLMNDARNTGTSSEGQMQEKESQFSREQTIIDVEVTDEDKK